VGPCEDVMAGRLAGMEQGGALTVTKREEDRVCNMFVLAARFGPTKKKKEILFTEAFFSFNTEVELNLRKILRFLKKLLLHFNQMSTEFK
jgi:hypothetical protein